METQTSLLVRIDGVDQWVSRNSARVVLLGQGSGGGGSEVQSSGGAMPAAPAGAHPPREEIRRAVDRAHGSKLVLGRRASPFFGSANPHDRGTRSFEFEMTGGSDVT